MPAALKIADMGLEKGFCNLQLSYIGGYRENSQNRSFSHSDPYKWCFYTNFAPKPQENNTKDFISEV